MLQVEDACEMHFQGIEVYNLHKIPSLTDRGAPFHMYSRNETERNLRDCNLKIPCLDTSEDLSDTDTEINNLQELFCISPAHFSSDFREARRMPSLSREPKADGKSRPQFSAGWEPYELR